MHITLRGQTYAGCRCVVISASAFIGARRIFKAYALAVRGLAMFKATGFIRRLTKKLTFATARVSLAEGCQLEPGHVYVWQSAWKHMSHQVQ